MKAWNKKLMTLACATCLTVGMGAVACADTVDLGYGQYANTSAGVKATKIEAIPTDAKLRSMEQNKEIQKLNEELVVAFNARLNGALPSDTPKFKGPFVDGYTIYQLSGDSQLGHNTGWLLTYNIDKNSINYINHATDDIINLAMQKKGVYSEAVARSTKPYAKSNEEAYYQIIKPFYIDGQKLQDAVKEYNQALHTKSNLKIDQAIMNSPDIPVQERESAAAVTKFILNNFEIGMNSLSYAPYQSKFGTMMIGSARGSIKYDGFMIPGTMSLYVLPSDDGLTIQVLASEDTSRDYWNQELQHMYGLTAINGGK